MQINYCDICGSPLKGNDFWTMYLTHDTNKEQEASDYYNDAQNYLKKIEKEVKDICPTCKKLIGEIFKLRLQNLNQLNSELLGIYKLPTKINKHERQNRKPKK